MSRLEEIGNTGTNRLLLDTLTGEITVEPIQQLTAYEPTVLDRARNRVTDALTGLGMDVYDARGMSERLLGRAFARPEADGLTNFMEGVGLLGSFGATAPLTLQQGAEDFQSGEYGSGALNTAFGLLEAAPLVGTVGRGAFRAGRDAISDVGNTIREARLPEVTYATHEAVPYAGLGRNVSERQVGVSPRPQLPGVLSMTPEEREAFTLSRSWADPETGEDVLLRAIGGDTLPTLRGQGVYDGPDGLETNPLMIARATGVTPEQMQATEALRGLLDVQGATPFTQLRGGDTPAMFIPHAENAGTLDDIERLRAATADLGADSVIDVGDGYIVTNFSGGAVNTSAAARRAVRKATGMSPVSTRIGSGYPGYEEFMEGAGSWEQGPVSAARRYLELIEGADPAATQAIFADPAAREAISSRTRLNFQQGRQLGGSNPTVDNVIGAVARSGPEALRPLIERTQAAEIPMQVPVLPRGQAPMIDATHFSRAPLEAIDPARQFSNPNIRGAEQALPAPYPAQSYFGVNVGREGGYVPERGVGDVPHRFGVPENEMLNIGQGFPRDIQSLADEILARREAASGSSMTPGARENLRQAYMMQIAKQRGFSGLLNPEHSLGAIGTTFYPVDLPTAGLLNGAN